MLSLGADVIGIDQHIGLQKARQSIPESVAMQGNLDPQFLTQFTPAEAAVKARGLLDIMRGRPGYIFNLGHGVPPGAALENITAVMETVRSFREVREL